MKAKPYLTTILSAGFLLAATLLGGCSGDGETAQSGAAAGSGGAPAPSQARAQRPIPAGAARGTVVETMDSGGYTYVLVDTGSGKIWAAAPEFAVAVGDEATFATTMPMRDYHSNTLDRTFPILYFVGAIEIGGDHGHDGTPAGHPKVGGAAAQPGSDIDLSGIKRAENGITVADLYAGKGALKGSRVTVRGKVVKYNSGIMGRNWLHIQDGSGGDGTNDITVTTDGVAQVGQTVLVTGKLNADVDFGAGYSYEVIIEEASVVVE